jgi:hypothetical protein
VQDLPGIKTFEDFQDFVKKYTGTAKECRFIDPRYISSSNVRLSKARKSDMAGYLLNYILHNKTYSEEARNCQTVRSTPSPPTKPALTLSLARSSRRTFTGCCPGRERRSRTTPSTKSSIANTRTPSSTTSRSAGRDNKEEWACFVAIPSTKFRSGWKRLAGAKT